jgi:CxxC-x17-CxxC domain-containing protein
MDERSDRRMYDAVCAKCGNDCQVPFEPTEGRPVYCRECYRPKRRF